MASVFDIIPNEVICKIFSVVPEYNPVLVKVCQNFQTLAETYIPYDPRPNIVKVIREGNLYLLKIYVQEKKYSPIDAANLALTFDKVEIFSWLHQTYNFKHIDCDMAAELDSPNCLEYLYSKECSVSTATFANAIESGSILCVKFLEDVCCPRKITSLDDAIHNGDFDMVKFLVEYCGLPVDNDCVTLALAKNEEMAKYLEMASNGEVLPVYANL